MGRRGENIHKRSDGRWEARVVCGSPVNGKTCYKSLYSRTYRGVKALKREFLETVSVQSQPECAGSENTAPMRSESVPVFRTIACDWLKTKKLSVKESTYAAYAFMVEKHLLPAFSDLAVKEIDADRIGTFLLDQKGHGSLKGGGPLSDKTVSEIKGVLNRIFRYAKAHNLIDSVPDSMPVSAKQPPIEVLTKQEQKQLETKALEEDTTFSLSVLLCMNTGIREGELCGLQWADFNWSNETVSISRTVSRISNTDHESGPKTRVVIGTPKTLCSIRTVPIPSNIVPYLKDRAKAKTDYVATGTGKFMEPRVCRDRFTRFEKRAGVKHHNFHTLRHTYSSNCVEEGMNVKVLSEILGHSDVNITLQRYVHPSLESKKAEVNKLTTFMNRGQN